MFIIIHQIFATSTAIAIRPHSLRSAENRSAVIAKAAWKWRDMRAAVAMRKTAYTRIALLFDRLADSFG
jgi:hypothetical protein